MSAVPTLYDRQYDFASYQTSNPNDPLPAAQIEAELDAIETWADATHARLLEIQQDDGNIKPYGTKGADLASASTLTIGSDGNYFDVTGTTAITAISAPSGGPEWVTLQFDGVLTLTHHATDLILPGGANITTAAGDHAIFWEYATDDWRCVSYTRAADAPWSGTVTESDISDLGTTVAMVADNLSVFASTTSAQLAGVISDETGSGALVFGTSPTLTTPALGTPSALVLTNATGLPEAQVTTHEAALSIAGSQLTGVVPLADGSVSAPAFTFSSDLDTGIYRSTDNTIDFSCGNSLKLKLDTAINAGANVIPVADLSVSLGTSSKRWTDLWLEQGIFVEGAAPSTPAAGHVAIYAKTDGLLYQKDDAGTETGLAAAGGGLPTTGGTMSGDINMGSGDITALDNLQFDTSPTTPLTAEGSLYWDATNHTLALHNDEADVTMQVGQELYIRVRNETGATINNGEVVYQSGTETGGEERPLITEAQANSESTALVLGVATHSIENNTYGYVTPFGVVNDLDTSSFSAGDPLYLSADTAGALTNTAPAAPNFAELIGHVITSNALTGNILVQVVPDISTPAGDASELVVQARKGSAGTITAGQVVYQSGWHAGSGTMEVELADSDAAATMPAIGVARSSITNSTAGTVVLSGKLTGIDTSSFSVGDALYVSGTAGAFTATRPTAATAEVQKIALCLRSNLSNGVIEIVGAGRSNDGPNKHTTDWFRIADNSDTTKLANWDLTALTTATTRTITMPDSNVNLGDVASAMQSLIDDISPQLGGQLDVNGNAIGDGTNELLTFTETASAANHVGIKNNILGSAPLIEAKGDDVNVDLELSGKASGDVSLLSQLNMNNNNITGANDVAAGTFSSTGDIDTSAGNISAATGDVTASTFTFSSPAGSASIVSTDVSGIMGENYTPTGIDVSLVSGTAGTSGNLSQWNLDGDLVDGPTPPSGTIVGTTDSQTLTNKTISGASNTLTVVADQVDIAGAGALPATADADLVLVEDVTDNTVKKATLLQLLAHTHSHAASEIVSGTLAHERGGLEADVSAYNGLVKISGGSTSAVTAPSGDIVGTTDTQTLTNKTLGATTMSGNLSLGTNWIIPSGGYGFQDGSGNEMMTFLPDIAAVNYIQWSNKATGGNPFLEAKGDDANVGINLVPKGSGVVQANGVEVVTTSGTQTLTNKSIVATQIDSGTLPADRLGADSIDTITEIAAALKSGSDGTLVTGTAGTSGNLVQWDANGDAVDSSVVASDVKTTRTGVYRTAWVGAAAMVPRTTNGAAAGTSELATNDVMLDTMDFDTATEEGVGFWVNFGDQYGAGTVKVKFYWTAASGSGTVKWDIAGQSYADNDAIDQALGTEQGVTDTLLLANDMHITSATAALTIADATAGEPVYFQITRDVATDTLGVDAQLIGCMIQYQESSTEQSAW